MPNLNEMSLEELQTLLIEKQTSLGDSQDQLKKNEIKNIESEIRGAKLRQFEKKSQEEKSEHSNNVITVNKQLDELRARHKEYIEKGPEETSLGWMQEQRKLINDINELTKKIPEEGFEDFKKLVQAEIGAPNKTLALLRQYDELQDTQKNYEDNMKYFYEAYEELKTKKTNPTIPKRIVDHMEYIGQLYRTSNELRENCKPDPKKTVSQNIQDFFNNKLFEKHYALYEECLKQQTSMEKWLSKTDGRKWDVSLTEKLKEKDCKQSPNSLATMPVQRPMRFELLLKGMVDVEEKEAATHGFIINPGLSKKHKDMEYGCKKINASCNFNLFYKKAEVALQFQMPSQNELDALDKNLQDEIKIYRELKEKESSLKAKKIKLERMRANNNAPNKRAFDDRKKDIDVELEKNARLLAKKMMLIEGIYERQDKLISKKEKFTFLKDLTKGLDDQFLKIQGSTKNEVEKSFNKIGQSFDKRVKPGWFSPFPVSDAAIEEATDLMILELLRLKHQTDKKLKKITDEPSIDASKKVEASAALSSLFENVKNELDCFKIKNDTDAFKELDRLTDLISEKIEDSNKNDVVLKKINKELCEINKVFEGKISKICSKSANIDEARKEIERLVVEEISPRLDKLLKKVSPQEYKSEKQRAKFIKSSSHLVINKLDSNTSKENISTPVKQDAQKKNTMVSEKAEANEKVEREAEDKIGAEPLGIGQNFVLNDDKAKIGLEPEYKRPNLNYFDNEDDDKDEEDEEKTVENGLEAHPTSEDNTEDDEEEEEDTVDEVSESENDELYDYEVEDNDFPSDDEKVKIIDIEKDEEKAEEKAGLDNPALETSTRRPSRW